MSTLPSISFAASLIEPHQKNWDSFLERLRSSYDVITFDRGISAAVSNLPTVLVIGTDEPISTQDAGALARHVSRGGGILVLSKAGADTTSQNSALRHLRCGIEIVGDTCVSQHYTGELHPLSCVMQHGAVARTLRTTLGAALDRRADASRCTGTPESPAIVLAHATTLSLTAPAVPLFSTGPLILPTHQPVVAAAVVRGGGRVVVIGAEEMWTTANLFKECNAPLADAVVAWAAGRPAPGTTAPAPAPAPATASSDSDDVESNKVQQTPDWLTGGATEETAHARAASGIGERRSVTDWAFLAHAPRHLMAGATTLPQRPADLVSVTPAAAPVSRAPATVPKTALATAGPARRVQMVNDVRKQVEVPPGPIDFVKPAMLRPAPPLRAAVHPPRPALPPGAPLLELFALEDEWGAAPDRLSRLAAGCVDLPTDEHALTSFVINAAQILGVGAAAGAEEPSTRAKAALVSIARDVFDWRRVGDGDDFDALSASQRIAAVRGVGGMPLDL